jgi:3-methyladenine DNA glycosylase AlkC
MPEPFKNLFNVRSIGALADAVRAAHPPFDRDAFMAAVFDDAWEGRELKARARHVTRCLGEALPADYRTALDILRRAGAAMQGYGFEAMVLPDFVEVYGLDDWEASIPALEQFTQMVSAEFAVRPFIMQDQPRMMAQMERWAEHENVHVRRLASEGCRPRLPWGIALPALKADPAPILPVLERLKLDPEEYVRRSVANNLNDIAKDNPQVVLDVLGRWREHDTPEMRQLMNRALRMLVKRGDPAALALLGYEAGGRVEVGPVTVKPGAIPMGGEVTFAFEVRSLSDAPQNLMIDYVVRLVRANGKHTPKVFKLTKASLPPGGALTVTRRHSFRPVTTRRYYPGPHAIEVQINGQIMGRAEFLVTDD